MLSYFYRISTLILVWIHIIVATSKISVTKYSRDWFGCLSHHEANELLALRKENMGRKIEFSLDLGASYRDIFLGEEGVLTDENTLILTWEEVRTIAKKKSCFSIYDDGSKPWLISTLSENTGIPASLCPPLGGPGVPTLVLGGFTMHRISGDNVNPATDTAAKLSSIRINRGNVVLDTCMGLGYTAIGAAKLVGQEGKVVTIEYDQASLEIASYNPWSQGLFDQTLPIEIFEGTVYTLHGSFA